MIQELIHKKYGVLYNRFYVCYLLRNEEACKNRVEYFSSKLHHQGIEDKLNCLSYQVFLEDLSDQIQGNIILIQDGARYHTSKDIREFLEKHQDRLFCFSIAFLFSGLQSD